MIICTRPTRSFIFRISIAGSSRFVCSLNGWADKHLKPFHRREREDRREDLYFFISALRRRQRSPLQEVIPASAWATLTPACASFALSPMPKWARQEPIQ